ncbi:hypothetical protein D3C87_1390220 [compost metagenome]
MGQQFLFAAAQPGGSGARRQARPGTEKLAGVRRAKVWRNRRAARCLERSASAQGASGPGRKSRHSSQPRRVATHPQNRSAGTYRGDWPPRQPTSFAICQAHRAAACTAETADIPDHHHRLVSADRFDSSGASGVQARQVVGQRLHRRHAPRNPPCRADSGTPGAGRAGAR